MIGTILLKTPVTFNENGAYIHDIQNLKKIISDTQDWVYYLIKQTKLHDPLSRELYLQYTLNGYEISEGMEFAIDNNFTAIPIYKAVTLLQKIPHTPENFSDLLLAIPKFLKKVDEFKTINCVMV